jgi:4-hydroxy-tetrahydrodipicolinate synthase
MAQLARIARLVLCAAILAAAPARAGEPPPFFQGVIVPMLTLYRDGDITAVDLDALRAFTSWLCRQRVSALFAVSGVGQWDLLAPAEKKEIIRTVVAAAGGKKPVIAGVGGRSAAETIALARFAIAEHVQAVAIVTPAFLRTGKTLPQDVLLQYYGEIAGALPREVPILVYDAQGEFQVETMRQLAAQHANIRAMKYRTDSAENMTRMAVALGDRIAVLSGIEYDTLTTLAVGGTGVIGGGANAFPNEIADIVDRFRAGDLPGARRAQQRILDFYDVLGRSVELKLLLRDLAGLPMAYSTRAGEDPEKPVAKDLPADAAHRAKLKAYFAPFVKPAAE